MTRTFEMTTGFPEDSDIHQISIGETGVRVWINEGCGKSRLALSVTLEDFDLIAAERERYRSLVQHVMQDAWTPVGEAAAQVVSSMLDKRRGSE